MKLTEEEAKYYYTAAQARKILGWDEQQLQYQVRKGYLRRVFLKGRSQGVYPIDETNAIVEEQRVSILDGITNKREE